MSYARLSTQQPIVSSTWAFPLDWPPNSKIHPCTSTNACWRI